MKTIGVLALQGDVSEHIRAIRACKESVIEVRTKQELSDIDALIIPGGESTAITLMIRKAGLIADLKRRIKDGMPVLATCAGTILLAKEVSGNAFAGLRVVDMKVSRNAYGRQKDSFEGIVKFKDGKLMRGIFIRAPRIVRVGKYVDVLAIKSNEPVVVRQNNIVCSTFHPELTGDLTLHRILIRLCYDNA